MLCGCGSMTCERVSWPAERRFRHVRSLIGVTEPVFSFAVHTGRVRPFAGPRRGSKLNYRRCRHVASTKRVVFGDDSGTIPTKKPAITPLKDFPLAHAVGA